MERRRLRALTVEGFTSIRSATVELGSLNVLVGANGAGKSNLIAALAMLGRIADAELGLFVAQSGGASTLLHGGPKISREIRLQLWSMAVGYRAELVPTADDELVFVGETALLNPGLKSRLPISGRGGYRESYVSSAVDGEPSAMRSAFETVADMLRGCRVFHFHDTSANAPVKQAGYVADNLTLHPDAGNLAAVLLRLREEDPAVYGRIVRDIQRVAPFFRDFVLVERNERIHLRWKQEGSDTVFPASALSDGTLRFICLTTLLNLPEKPALIVLDEPELGLHPYAMVQLADMLRSASQGSQVVLATQSVTLMDQFALEDLIVAERHDGASSFSRPDPDRLREWLEEYSLGELWLKNLIGGRPRPEQG
ncbi:putative ATPase [Nocardiopsis mwathae]|uniref:Putative ATPase n=1 Tax=Nocardiopsis mwathae TaxID=1472723 RepID=A0A7X0D3H1_9ACTN|nr:AAA family ATPase [Nocardiopsis mwathae]MBB6170060.1 putative ATPase [Nocardiopsis mwathae]